MRATDFITEQEKQDREKIEDTHQSQKSQEQDTKKKVKELANYIIDLLELGDRSKRADMIPPDAFDYFKEFYDQNWREFERDFTERMRRFFYYNPDKPAPPFKTVFSMLRQTTLHLQDINSGKYGTPSLTSLRDKLQDRDKSYNYGLNRFSAEYIDMALQTAYIQMYKKLGTRPSIKDTLDFALRNYLISSQEQSAINNPKPQQQDELQQQQEKQDRENKERSESIKRILELLGKMPKDQAIAKFKTLDPDLQYQILKFQQNQ
jgi:hypothetical protein